MDIITENQESVDSITDPSANEPAPQLEAKEPLNEPASGQAPNPLSPGGKRFEQVYAQSKQAQRDLVAEREKRAALEARLEALETRQTATVKTDEEYTPAQLEAFIANNQISRADAAEYTQKLLLKKATSAAKQEFQQEFSANDRINKLTHGIAEYVQTIPAISDKDSADRQRLEEEFEWLASVQGVQVAKLAPADKKALELTALRNVFGSIESVKKRTAVTTNTETQQEISGGTPPSKNPNPDQALLNALKPFEVAHYKKMMAAGRYQGGWADVVAELKFDPNNRTKPQVKK